MSDIVEKYPELKEKGLNEDEIKTLSLWIDQGKPGLAQSRAEGFGDLYVMGYSCREIHKMFPQYPYESILFARAQYNWDELRQKYREQVQSDIAFKAASAKAESIKFLSELISATHVKWRKEILTYIANPDREKPPKCLPDSIHQYGSVVSLLQELIQPSGPGRPNKDGQQPMGATPLVSVTVKSGSDKPDVVVSGNVQDIVKEALLAETSQDGGDGKPN